MSEQEPEAIERILAEVRRYVAAHPAGTETAAGIMRWWLHADPDAAGSIADIERALERLEAEGVLERVATPNGRDAYRTQPRR
jgi:Fe2+ or Zn2+ uptake regulation protein